MSSSTAAPVPSTSTSTAPAGARTTPRCLRCPIADCPRFSDKKMNNGQLLEHYASFHEGNVPYIARYTCSQCDPSLKFVSPQVSHIHWWKHHKEKKIEDVIVALPTPPVGPAASNEAFIDFLQYMHKSSFDMYSTGGPGFPLRTREMRDSESQHPETSISEAQTDPVCLPKKNQTDVIEVVDTDVSPSLPNTSPSASPPELGSISTDCSPAAVNTSHDYMGGMTPKSREPSIHQQLRQTTLQPGHESQKISPDMSPKVSINCHQTQQEEMPAHRSDHRHQDPRLRAGQAVHQHSSLPDASTPIVTNLPSQVSPCNQNQSPKSADPPPPVNNASSWMPDIQNIPPPRPISSHMVDIPTELEPAACIRDPRRHQRPQQPRPIWLQLFPILSSQVAYSYYERSPARSTDPLVTAVDPPSNIVSPSQSSSVCASPADILAPRRFPRIDDDSREELASSLALIDQRKEEEKNAERFASCMETISRKAKEVEGEKMKKKEKEEERRRRKKEEEERERRDEEEREMQKREREEEERKMELMENDKQKKRELKRKRDKITGTMFDLIRKKKREEEQQSERIMATETMAPKERTEKSNEAEETPPPAEPTLPATAAVEEAAPVPTAEEIRASYADRFNTAPKSSPSKPSEVLPSPPPQPVPPPSYDINQYNGYQQPYYCDNSIYDPYSFEAQCQAAWYYGAPPPMFFGHTPDAFSNTSQQFSYPPPPIAANPSTSRKSSLQSTSEFPSLPPIFGPESRSAADNSEETSSSAPATTSSSPRAHDISLEAENADTAASTSNETKEGEIRNGQKGNGDDMDISNSRSPSPVTKPDPSLPSTSDASSKTSTQILRERTNCDTQPKRESSAGDSSGSEFSRMAVADSDENESWSLASLSSSDDSARADIKDNRDGQTAAISPESSLIEQPKEYTGNLTEVKQSTVRCHRAGSDAKKKNIELITLSDDED